jgi:hypothetical protein
VYHARSAPFSGLRNAIGVLLGRQSAVVLGWRPIAALLSRRHPIIGLSLFGMIFVNALAHLVEFARADYNPGALTAFILFLPLSIWVACVCFGKDGLPLGGLGFIVLDGVILHAILIASTKLFLLGVFGARALIVSQVLNAALLLLLAWLAERWLGGKAVHPFPTRSSH